MRTLPGSAKLLRLASDERLVEQVRAGSRTAFEVVYDRHHRGILAFCRHMLGSREEAEDAVQHTFMAAYRSLLGSQEPIQLRAWLYAIARNRCLSMLRARRERPSDELDERATDGLAAEVQRRADLQDMLHDLAQLPEEQRAALVLSELGDMAHDEIATVVGCPREKVKALVFQARSSLQQSREARETPCHEIREMLSTLSGGALRRSSLRRHVNACGGCQAFEQEVKRQRRALAVVLPVVPTLGLKESALAAAFGSNAAAGAAATGGAAAAGGGAAAAGGTAGSAAAGGAVAAGGASALVAKVLVVAAVASGGSVAGYQAVSGGGGSSATPPSQGPSTPAVPTVEPGDDEAAPARATPASDRAGTGRDKARGKGAKGRGNRKGRDGHRGDGPPENRGTRLAETRGEGKKHGLRGTQPAGRGQSQQRRDAAAGQRGRGQERRDAARERRNVPQRPSHGSGGTQRPSTPPSAPTPKPKPAPAPSATPAPSQKPAPTPTPAAEQPSEAPAVPAPDGARSGGALIGKGN